jgi:uncharacterized protein with PIN domain
MQSGKIMSYFARWLRSKSYEVFFVYEEARGINDNFIIQKAFRENWILIISDKDSYSR